MEDENNEGWYPQGKAEDQFWAIVIAIAMVIGTARFGFWEALKGLFLL